MAVTVKCKTLPCDVGAALKQAYWLEGPHCHLLSLLGWLPDCRCQLDLQTKTCLHSPIHFTFSSPSQTNTRTPTTILTWLPVQVTCSEVSEWFTWQTFKNVECAQLGVQSWQK